MHTVSNMTPDDCRHFTRLCKVVHAWGHVSEFNNSRLAQSAVHIVYDILDLLLSQWSAQAAWNALDRQA